MVFFYKVYICRVYRGDSIFWKLLKGICTGYSERYPIRISIGYTGNPSLKF